MSDAKEWGTDPVAPGLRGERKDQATGSVPNLDGRNIDPRLGVLEGEGALQRVEDRTEFSRGQARAETLARHPGLQRDHATYYGLPNIKEPVWIWSVPLYFYVGGLAGATSVMGTAARLAGRGQFQELVRRARWVGTLGDMAGGGLLIHDLGRPERFLNMLRVLRPTSPMSLGSWILAGSGSLNTASLLFGDDRGLTGALGALGEYGGGLMGLALSGYTGVLLGNTAVPLWQAGHRLLPQLFIASSMGSAGSLFQLMDLPPPDLRVARRLAIAGQAAELLSGAALERKLARIPAVGRPLHEGLSGTLWKASKVLTAASLVLSILPGEQKWKRRAAGLLGSAGAIGMRFAIFHAGRRSARDATASFAQQRQGQGAREVTGLSAVASPTTRAVATDPMGGYRLPVVG